MWFRGTYVNIKRFLLYVISFGNKMKRFRQHFKYDSGYLPAAIAVQREQSMEKRFHVLSLSCGVIMDTLEISRHEQY